MRAQIVHHQNGIWLTCGGRAPAPVRDRPGALAWRSTPRCSWWPPGLHTRAPLTPSASARSRAGTSVGPLPARSSRTSTGHLSRHPALIQEHQALHGKRIHLLAVSLALTGDLGSLLLGRPERLFFDVSLRRWSVRHITGRLTCLPVSANKRWAYWSRRASLVSATSAWSSAARRNPASPAGPPRWGFGLRRPS